MSKLVSPTAPQRLTEIDLLRGLTILSMIIIHANAYFLGNPLSYALWDGNQFAVPAFIFCSAYIYFLRSTPFHPTAFLAYLKKRVARLLYPYYLFALIFIGIIYYVEPHKINLSFLQSSLFLVGGIDINWLVLLFLQFSLIFPFITFVEQKYKYIFWGFAFVSILSTVLFLFVSWPFNYRYIMWLPWSSILFFTIYFLRNEKKRWFYAVTFLGSFFLFLLSREIQLLLHHSIRMYDNKYPPTLLQLSYGAFWITFFMYIFKQKLFTRFPLKEGLSYLSRHSYSIYFVHFAFLYVFTTSYHYWTLVWWQFLGIILTGSIISQVCVSTVLLIVKKMLRHYRFSILNKGPTI